MVLTFSECLMRLKPWILPLLVFLAGAVFATDNAIGILRIFCNVVLRLTLWDLTHDMLTPPDDEGGFSLPQPKAFLCWQHSPAFRITEPTLSPTTAAADFKHFAHPPRRDPQGSTMSTALPPPRGTRDCGSNGGFHTSGGTAAHAARRPAGPARRH